MTAVVVRPWRSTSLSTLEVLESEHALTRRMLAVLDAIARGVRSGVGFPSNDVAELIGFFREFVEVEHHAKEDVAVYPLALAEGDDRAAEIVGELVADHAETRELLQSLSLFWEPGELLEEEREGFAALAMAYSRRLRRHMRLEESALFPFASQLGCLEDQRIVRTMRGLQRRPEGAAHWESLADRLEPRWLGDVV